MTVCPVAVVAGCKKCPIVAVCPLKGVIGDYRKDEDSKVDSPASKDQEDEQKS